MKKILIYSICILSLVINFSCNKDWLEQKRDIKLIVPTSLSDMELLLNNGFDFQFDGRGATETSCDDYEFTTEQFNSLYNAFDRDLVVWQVKEFPKFGSLSWDEWDLAYSQIQVCNVVLKGLTQIQRKETNKAIYDRIKGTALFYRSRQFLNLALSFCKYYNSNTSKMDLGIPIKLTDDIEEHIVRGNLEQTYQRIILDLKESGTLLPSSTTSKTQIAKGGAYAMLARTYFYMNNYKEAMNASDSSLFYHNFVEDFNNIDPKSDYPFSGKYQEMHLFSLMSKYSPNSITGRIEQSLIDSYANTDLRKTVFFKLKNDNKYTFKGSLSTSQLFSGTSTGEVLLIGAECRARLGDQNGAVKELLKLLSKRYISGTTITIPTQNARSTLDYILAERRKELVARGLRWQDLKRLNQDNIYAKTLYRKIGNETYSLTPNDPRYIMHIPRYIIDFNKIEQNQY